jgi:regulator of sigma E protease
MNVLITILAFVFALGVLIVVHELGHYWVARLCGVKVLRFSVGFGRPLVSRRFGPDRTEWAIGAFPIGGYVKMLDEHEGEVATAELPRAFNRQTPGRRIAIVAAGPAANFVLAVLLYWAVFIHGFPGTKPVIGGIAQGSPAAAAQFAVGETLVTIEGEPVGTWQDARWLLLKHAMEKATPKVEVQNARGDIAQRRLDLSRLAPEDLDADFLAKLGFTRLQPPLPPVIGRVLAGGAAERGGLKGGDEIVAIDGTRITRWDEVVKIVSDNPARALDFELRRENALVEATVTPEAVRQGDRELGRIGAAPHVDQAALEQYVVHQRYGPIAALGKALDKTWDTSAFTLKMVGKMLVGEVSLKNLSGPITIADYAGQSAMVGWLSYVLFLTLISISLGVLNLLPIPLLDGGHLMYYMVEIVKGSPVSQTAMEVGQQVGMGVLLVLMAFALYNDFTRLFYG